MEKLCGSIGLSLIFVYLGAWAIYCFSPGESAQRSGFIGISAICAFSEPFPSATFWSSPGRCGCGARRRLRRIVCVTLLIVARSATTSALAGSATGWNIFNARCSFCVASQWTRRTRSGAVPPADDERAFAHSLWRRPATPSKSFQVASTFLNLLLFFSCALMLPSSGRAAAGRRCRCWCSWRAARW